MGDSEGIESIGRYQVTRRIGAGAMGVVYAARDPHLDREVAIKLARPGGASEVTMARAVREAQALARLEHPNVVTIFDVGVHDGRLFLAMELVDGVSLGEWLAQVDAGAWREKLQVLSAAGRALAAAHERGLIHRDFKPDNVVVTDEGRPVVLDFGLVRPAEILEAAKGGDAGRPLEARLTDSLAILGTPAYMAPEQLRGLEVDPRADQYAFAAVLYEALFGYAPHPMGSLAELVESVIDRRPRAVPSGSPVPPPVTEAVLRGLRRDAGERFPSMEALLGALEGAAQGPAQRAAVRPKASRAPWALVGCAALAALAVTGLALALVGWRWVQPEPPAHPTAIQMLPAAEGAVPVGPVVAPIDLGPGGGPGVGAETVPGQPVDPPEPARPTAGERSAAPAATAMRRDAERRPVMRAPREAMRLPAQPANEVAGDNDDLDTGPFIRDVVRRCWRGYQEEQTVESAVTLTLLLRVAADGSVTRVETMTRPERPTLSACIASRGRDWQGFGRYREERRAQEGILLRPQ